MGNKKQTKVTRKMTKKTAHEVPEDDRAGIIDGGSQDQGGSQNQERIVLETQRAASEARTDSETEQLRNNVMRRSKRKRIESMGSIESTEDSEEERSGGEKEKREKAKK